MGEGPQNCLQLSSGCACNPGRLYSEGQHHEFWILSPLESWTPHPSPTCLPESWAYLLAFLMVHFFPQDIYENLDLRQRRASSPGYIDSPTYSRQGMSPTFSRSPHHYYRSGKEGGTT